MTKMEVETSNEGRPREEPPFSGTLELVSKPLQNPTTSPPARSHFWNLLLEVGLPPGFLEEDGRASLLPWEAPLKED